MRWLRWARSWHLMLFLVAPRVFYNSGRDIIFYTLFFTISFPRESWDGPNPKVIFSNILGWTEYWALHSSRFCDGPENWRPENWRTGTRFAGTSSAARGRDGQALRGRVPLVLRFSPLVFTISRLVPFPWTMRNNAETSARRLKDLVCSTLYCPSRH